MLADRPNLLRLCCQLRDVLRASAYSASRPSIVTSKAYDADTDAESYFYAKLLFHSSWSEFDEQNGPSWLLPEDNGSH